MKITLVIESLSLKQSNVLSNRKPLPKLDFPGCLFLKYALSPTLKLGGVPSVSFVHV